MKTWAVSDGIAFPQMPASAKYGFFRIKPMVCNVKLHGSAGTVQKHSPAVG
jgi:hypothetical protein